MNIYFKVISIGCIILSSCSTPDEVNSKSELGAKTNSTTATKIGTKYSDWREEASLRMDAKDHGMVMQHGDAPNNCDSLGARNAWIFEEEGTYYMHYDALSEKGWLSALAVSNDLKTWEKKGTVLDFGKPGSSDAKVACHGITFFDNNEWYMYYLGSPNTGSKLDIFPYFPYQTHLAKAESASGPWVKQKGIAIKNKPDTYYSHCTSPGQVIKTEDEYLQFISVATRVKETDQILRSLSIARTKNLNDKWVVDSEPILPDNEQIENTTLYFEKDINTWFMFTNHIGIDELEYTDAIWVYWTKDLNTWDSKNKAVVLDGQNCNWAEKCIGLPSVLQVDNKLAIIYDAAEGNSTSHFNRNIGLAWLDLPLSIPK
ncbi:MAG: hypothetical protein HRT71_07650 [Flavobacteriales bacterium]|nr:hypothetical protein [Flavobacteriales bacterium]